MEGRIGSSEGNFVKIIDSQNRNNTNENNINSPYNFERNSDSPKDNHNSTQDEIELKSKSLKLKEEGKNLFANKDYKKAYQKFSEAIELYPKDGIYYTNRAQCARK